MTTFVSVYDPKTNTEWQIPMENESNYFSMESFLTDYLKLTTEDASVLQGKLEEIKIYSVNEFSYLEGEDPLEIGISKEIINKLVNYNK